MAKLIRCSSGHIYDSETHTACPECERMGLTQVAAEPVTASSGGAASPPSGLPKGLLAIGAAGVLALAGLGYFLLKPSDGDKGATPNPKPTVQTAASEDKTETKSGTVDDKPGDAKPDAPSPPKDTQTADKVPEQAAADPKSDPDFGACEKGEIAACDRAIASKSFSGQPLGSLYRFRGFAKSHAAKPDLDAAIADFDESVRLEPNSFVPVILRANAYSDKGDQALAIKDYDRAIELNPRADFYNNRGNALRKTGAVDKAIADLDQAIKLDPNYYGSYWNRGLAYQDKGDKTRAADDYKKALTLNPNDSARTRIEALLKEVAPSPGAPTQADPTKDPDKDTDKADGKKSSNDGPAPTGSDSGKSDTAGPSPTGTESGKSKTADSTAPDADSDKDKDTKPDPKVVTAESGPAPQNVKPPESKGSTPEKQGSSETPASDENSSTKPNAVQPTPTNGESAADRGSSGGRPGGNIINQADSPPALPPGGVTTTVLPGVYRMNGINGRGDKYVAMVSLVKDGKTYRLTAWNGDNLIRGSGQFNDGSLRIKYNTGVTTLFNLNSNATLDGKWTKGGGTEQLVPFAFSAANDMLPAEGDYRVAGKRSDDGKPTFGTAKLSKRGTGYQVAWSYDDGDKFDGWGTFAHNVLSFVSSNNAGWSKDAGLVYALQPDGALAGLFASGFGEEKLTPVAWSPTPTASDDADKVQPEPGPSNSSDSAPSGSGNGASSLTLDPSKSANNAPLIANPALKADSQPSSKDGDAASPGPAAKPEEPASSGTSEQEIEEAAKDADFKACYLADGDRKKVLEICERAIKSGKFKGAVLSELYLNKGLLTKDVDEALALYDETVKLDPKSTLGYVGRARMYLYKDKPDRAIKNLDTAVELSPKRTSVYVLRAEAKARNNDIDAAMTDFDKALEIDANYAPAYESRGHVVERKGDKTAAMRDYVKASELDPKRHTAFLAIGTLNMVEKKYDDALKGYAKVIELRPDWAFGYISRGKVYLSMNDAEHAQADLDKASALDAEGMYKPMIEGMQRRLSFAKE